MAQCAARGPQHYPRPDLFRSCAVCGRPFCDFHWSRWGDVVICEECGNWIQTGCHGAEYVGGFEDGGGI